MKNIFLLTIVMLMVIACTKNPKTNQISGNFILNNDTCQLIDSYLTKLAAENNFSGGLLIIRQGEKIFSKGYGWADKEKKIPFTPATLASMGSITKAFTAAAILKLAEQNKVSLTDSLKKFFPAIPADKANITIHQLLTHSSGFHEFLKQDGGDYEKFDTEHFLQRAFSEPLAFRPGEKAVYTNVGMSILAIIIEQVSGLDYETYLRKNLFEPIGITKIGYHYPVSKDDSIAVGYQNGKAWGTHPQHFEKAGGGPYWNLKGNGGLEVSLNEMYLWADAISNQTILSDSTIKTMFTPQIQEEGYGGDSWFGYGCNISKSRRNTKMIDNGGSNGIYFARLIRLPEEGVIFYMVTNESSINTNMVLPNVTQLYFKGTITQDAMQMHAGMSGELTKKVYELVKNPATTDLGIELAKENITVQDDMVLLEVGQRLIAEKNTEKALVLYKYYTKTFPNIVVAWNDMGDVYLLKNKKEDAITCYRQALKIRPTNPRAQASLKKLEK